MSESTYDDIIDAIVDDNYESAATMISKAKLSKNEYIDLLMETIEFTADSDDKDGAITLIDALIKESVEINEKDEDGNTALHCAIINADLKIVKYLIEKGADIYEKNEDQYTALALAEKEKDKNNEIIFFIKETRSKKEQEKTDAINTEKAKKELSESPAEIEKIIIQCNGKITDKNFNSLIQNIKNSAQLDNKCSDLLINTAVHIKDETQQKQIADVLIAKANGNDIINKQNKEGSTALNCAISNNNPSFVKYLIEKGANINAKDTKGSTALHVAIEKNNLELVKYLIKKGADINAENNEKYSPLEHAIDKDNTKIVKFLKDKQKKIILDNSREENKDAKGRITLEIISDVDKKKLNDKYNLESNLHEHKEEIITYTYNGNSKKPSSKLSVKTDYTVNNHWGNPDTFNKKSGKETMTIYDDNGNEIATISSKNNSKKNGKIKYKNIKMQKT